MTQENKELEIWKPICAYESVTKASASTGISRTSISNNLSNKSKSAGGFVWKKI